MTKIERQGVIYLLHPNGTLTCGPLDQSGMVGGTGEQDRNATHNPTRLQRIKQFHPNPKVLDYGCGSGLFVEFLRKNGIKAEGFDKYLKSSNAYLFNGDLAFSKDEYDIITMVEVMEHTASPYLELQNIFHILKPGGILMIETSFTDWMDLETDTYINPRIGHSTIFSHRGLDELMAEKGFEFFQEINRNVRVYKKPEPPFDPKITLITMGQANPVALKRTIESFSHLVDEVIFGDLLIFESDRQLIESYVKDYPLRIIPLPFNYIFENGFSATLNKLAEYVYTDWVLYMNVSEVMDGEHFVKEQMSKQHNCYSFDHAVDPHRWFRLYNRKELQWEGVIHEEVRPLLGIEGRPCPFHVFRMKDTIKDDDNPFKAKVANDVKELVYFQNYLRLVDQPEKGATHSAWVAWAKDSYESMKERLLKKGKRCEAFQKGNLQMYLDDIHNNPEFERERFVSSTLVNFQGDRKLL
jgi:SAM-dependent methyltransferase